MCVLRLFFYVPPLIASPLNDSRIDDRTDRERKRVTDRERQKGREEDKESLRDREIHRASTRDQRLRKRRVEKRNGKVKGYPNRQSTQGLRVSEAKVVRVNRKTGCIVG